MRIRNEAAQATIQIANNAHSYLPDGTPITTAIEERNLHAAAKKRVEEVELRMEEAEARAAEETDRRQALERELEQLRRQLENR